MAWFLTACNNNTSQKPSIMKPSTTPRALALAIALLTLSLTACHGSLEVGFYNGKCGLHNVEVIIRRIVAARFIQDPTIVAALLRMQFHDCFVNGCDASLLLDGDSSEKTAIPNLTVRGYDIIDEAKAALEAACPGVVSCADIIVAAARDAVALGGGIGYAVPMGRRDGNVSLATNVDLPSPFISVAASIDAFDRKGLDTIDMVLLLGCHTVGVAHCSLITHRLYNFNGTGQADPTMDPDLVKQLQKICPQNTPTNNTVNLDQNPLSSNIVDDSYYREILVKKGILDIDQRLALDPTTRPIVQSLTRGFGFPFQFQFRRAMVKMSQVQVLTGEQGEIRKSCGAINSA